MSDPARLTGPDGEDEVEASRAPLMDHLVELRQRLILLVAALGVGFVGLIFVSKSILIWLLMPFRAAEARVSGTPLEETELAAVGLAPLEIFFVQLKISFIGALMIIFPIICWQIYAFVAPGLYKNERGAMLPFMVLSPVLFAAGVAFVYMIVMPFVMTFSLSMEQVESVQGISIEVLPQVAPYLDLVTTLMLVFGLSFQMPVLMMLLAKAGLVRARTLLSGWRFAVVGIALFAAFATPPDPISQFVLGTVLFGLYFVSIGLMKLMEPKEDSSSEG